MSSSGLQPGPSVAQLITSTQTPRSARRVSEDWHRLCAATPEPAAFDQAMVADLPFGIPVVGYDRLSLREAPPGASLSRSRPSAPTPASPSPRMSGWWWGTDRQDEGEFFRARITAISFR